MNWPLSVLLIFVVIGVWAAFDSWLKLPYISKQVDDMKIVARGDKAVDHVIDKRSEYVERGS